MKGFEEPKPVTAVELVFGGDMQKLLPKYSAIPDEFKSSNSGNRWVKFQSDWFFNGLAEEDIPKAKPGIDGNTAMAHLAAIQASWEPKHEHKAAGVAYLASLWFE